MFKALVTTIIAIIAMGTANSAFEDGSTAHAALASITGGDTSSQAGPFDLGGGRTVDQMLNTHNTTFNY